MSARQLGFGDLHALPHADFQCTVGTLSISSHDGRYFVDDEAKNLFADRDADTAIHTFLEAFFLQHDVAIRVIPLDGFCLDDELEVSDHWPDGYVELLARRFHKLVRLRARPVSAHLRLDLKAIDAKNKAARNTELSHCDALADGCDPNTIMGAAFVDVVGRESVSASKLDSELWNCAWDFAKEHGYSNTWQEKTT